MLVSTFKRNAGVGQRVVVMIHGRAHRMGVMSIFERAAPSDAHFLHVQAPIPDPEGGFCWWVKGEAPDMSLGELFTTITTVCTEQAVTELPLFLFGFSQGAAMVGMVLQRWPALSAGAALLAGFVPELAITHEKAADVRQHKTPVFIAHGRQDDVIPLSLAEKGGTFLNSLGYEVTFLVEDVAHKVGTQGMRALKEWSAAR